MDDVGKAETVLTLLTWLSSAAFTNLSVAAPHESSCLSSSERGKGLNSYSDKFFSIIVHAVKSKLSSCSGPEFDIPTENETKKKTAHMQESMVTGKSLTTKIPMPLKVLMKRSMF